MKASFKLIITLVPSGIKKVLEDIFFEIFCMHTWKMSKTIYLNLRI